MYSAYFTTLDNDFAKALAALFEKNGFPVVTELQTGIEIFIDTTDFSPADDDRALGEGLSEEAGMEAYEKNVNEPIAKLQNAILFLSGRRRVCFLSSKASSIQYSEATTGFARNMAKAALHQILTITKNTLISRGYTFRLFDPMTGEVPVEQAAAAAFVYFTRDRYIDGPTEPTRDDELNLLLRDAKGREIPW